MMHEGEIGIQTFLSTRWQKAMQAALERNAGELMPGLAHNLHNYAHSFSMQMELLYNAWQQNPEASLSSQQRSLQRMTGFSSDFSSACAILSNRNIFTQFEPDRVDLVPFLDWLQAFWRHNLFFKHRIQLDISLGQEVPEQVYLHPGGLVYCLEEGLKNGMESLAEAGGNQANYHFQLKVTAGREVLEFVLQTPTSLDPSLDHWQVGSSTKTGHLGLGLPLLRIGCREMDWECRLSGDSSLTTLSFTVPTL